MKILVTGGAGFIGAHVAEYYAGKGNGIIALDNLSRRRMLGRSAGDPLYNWNYLRSNYKDVELVEADIVNFERVREASKDVDVIVHAAAQVAVTTSLSDPRMDFDINALGTFNVLEAARLSDAAVVYCSTNKVYGGNVNKIPIRQEEKRYCFVDETYANGISEAFPVDACVHTPYGCSKLSGDLYVQDYAYTYGLKTGVFRMSCIFGERQFGVEDQGWVAWFVIATLTNRPITIYGNGKQVRDLLYVCDLVKAYDAFVRSGVRHGVFNIGGGPQNAFSLLELLEIIESLTKTRPKIFFSDWRPGDQTVYISNISRLKENLKWTPTTPIEEGLKRYVNWALLAKSQEVF